MPQFPLQIWRIVNRPPYDQEAEMQKIQATATTAPKVQTPFVNRGREEGANE
jgi:hypothetical protein